MTCPEDVVRQGDHWRVATAEPGLVEVVCAGNLAPQEARAMAEALHEIADIAAPYAQPPPPGYRPK